jgi:hypothetical protein
MTNPVILPSGRSFERKVIEQLFNNALRAGRNPTDPISRQQIPDYYLIKDNNGKYINLIPNLALKATIERELKMRGLTMESLSLPQESTPSHTRSLVH